MKVRRAACYIRVSTDDQIEYSPDSQLREMRIYAKQHNIEILENHIYIDEGISGRKAETRPRFQAMIANAKTKPKPFDLVLLYKFSRFARNREDSVVYKSLLRKKCGIDVISIKEPLDCDNKMSIIMEAFIEAMDEYYSINLSEDVRRTMTEKALRGEYQSSPPFGYQMKNKALVPVQNEAAAVKTIFEKFLSGESYLSIAHWLNLAGFKTHRGNPFENRTVEYIIKNPVYIGKTRWTPSGKDGRKHSDNTIIADSTHEPLVSKEVWEKAQQRAFQLKSTCRPRATPQNRNKDWLSGLVVCASCGRALVKCGPYWRCGGYAHGLCQNSQYISDQIIKDAVIKRIANDIRCEADSNSLAIRQGQDNKSRIAGLQSQLKKFNTALERARKAYLIGADTLEEYSNNKSSIISKIEQINQEIKALKDSENPEKLAADLHNYLERPEWVLIDPDLPMTVKYSAAHSIFKKMIFDRQNNRLKIEYRLDY